MKAYKCDICGGLFAEEIPLIVVPKGRAKRLVYLKNDIDYLDVCPTCTKLIQGVIDSRRQEAQQCS